MDREKFLASIYLIIKDDSGRILFQRRRGTKLWSGFLGLPAGHVDIGENVYDAAIREAKEELIDNLNGIKFGVVDIDEEKDMNRFC